MKWANTNRQKQLFADVLLDRCSENFFKFHRKTPVLESRFNKIAGRNFIKDRLQRKCFPVKFAKFLRTPFFTEHLRWLLLNRLNLVHVNDQSIWFLPRPYHFSFFKGCIPQISHGLFLKTCFVIFGLRMKGLNICGKILIFL